MKHPLALLSAFAMVSGMDPNWAHRPEAKELTPEELYNKKVELYKHQGLKEYVINGLPIWSFNEKAAIKQFRKLMKNPKIQQAINQLNENAKNQERLQSGSLPVEEVVGATEEVIQPHLSVAHSRSGDNDASQGDRDPVGPLEDDSP